MKLTATELHSCRCWARYASFAIVFVMLTALWETIIAFSSKRLKETSQEECDNSTAFIPGSTIAGTVALSSCNRQLQKNDQ